MKKKLSVLLAVIMIVSMSFAITGCSKDEEASAKESTEAQEEPQEQSEEEQSEEEQPEEAEGESEAESTSSGGFSFDYNKGANVVDDGNSMTVYINGDESIPYYSVCKLDSVPDVTQLYNDEMTSVENEYGVRIVSSPSTSTVDGNDRELTGIEYAFSSEDGASTIKAMDYIDVYNGIAYRWTAFYTNDADRTTITHAMETFDVE